MQLRLDSDGAASRPAEDRRLNLEVVKIGSRASFAMAQPADTMLSAGLR